VRAVKNIYRYIFILTQENYYIKMLSNIMNLSEDDLYVLGMINLYRLKLAINRMKDREFFNFRLFEYTSGTVNRIRYEGLLPSGRYISEYLRSTTLFHSDTLIFKLWSRECGSGKRELFLNMSAKPDYFQEDSDECH